MQYITHDVRPTNKSNLHIRRASYDRQTIELVSYNTVVALGKLKHTSHDAETMGHLDIFDMVRDSNWYYTAHKYSPTTSKQVTCFLNEVCGGRKNATEVDAKVFNQFDSFMWEIEATSLGWC